MKHHSIATKEKESFKALKEQFHFANVMQAPKLQKVVVSVGTGSQIKKDKKRNDLVAARLATVTGQKVSPRAAKKAIASYKSREGDTIGYVVTLRGVRMMSFLEKLLNVALPRTKDFKGINRTAVDSMGNLTIGIKEHTIFPETADEDLKDVFGLAVTVVSSARNKKEAEAFYEALGFPLKKE
ncbi:50S ribosomal protein L5 [Candidatus Parcubacteria bacterium]|nr:50S ribosomal protein L5 [Candidatus Parcubacteria bacterium]